MPVSIRSLGIDHLGVEDRLALVQELWDSILADGTAVPLTGAQRAELDRRIAADETDPNDVVSWAEIHVSISARLKG